MAIEDDFTINQSRVIQLRANHSGEQYSVLELHRWLQSLADDPANDNIINITSPNPSARITDNHIRLLNGFSITPGAVEKLREGGTIEVDRMPEDIVVEEKLPKEKIILPTIRLIRE